MNQFFFSQLFWFLTKNRHFQNAEIPIEIITENLGPHGYLPLTSISRKISNFAKRAETTSVRFPMQKNAIPRVSEFIAILLPTFLKIGQIHQHPHSYLRFTIPGAKAPYMGLTLLKIRKTHCYLRFAIPGAKTPYMGYTSYNCMPT